MDILKLKEERIGLIADSRKAFEAYSESRKAEDGSKYEAIEADIVRVEDIIAKAEKAEARDSREKSIVSETAQALAETAPRGDLKESAYREDIDRYLHEGVMSPRLQEAALDGSVLVPKTFEDKVVMGLNDASIMRQICTVKTRKGDALIPASGTTGASAWIAKNGAYPTTAADIAGIQMEALKVGQIIGVPEEEVADAYESIEAYIAAEFGRANGEVMEAGFISGDNSGAPAGLLHATLGATEAVEAALATAFTYTELMELFYGVSGAYAQNGTWLMNRATLKDIRNLKSGDNYIFAPGISLDEIEGKPVKTSSAFPTIATGVAAVAFGDFSFYQIVDRAGFYIQKLNELYAANGQIGFKGTNRTDGQLIKRDAVKTLVMA